jgi:hypothetical protein
MRFHTAAGRLSFIEGVMAGGLGREEMLPVCRLMSVNLHYEAEAGSADGCGKNYGYVCISCCTG